MDAVFVYGSLKRGGCNHHYLAGAPCLGAAATVAQYALYLGEWPFLIRDEARHCVRGEVYVVDAPMLARLDVLEGHPQEYQREIIEVRLDSGALIPAWVYFYPCPEGQLLTKGEYLIDLIG